MMPTNIIVAIAATSSLRSCLFNFIGIIYYFVKHINLSLEKRPSLYKSSYFFVDELQLCRQITNVVSYPSLHSSEFISSVKSFPLILRFKRSK
jgi:hypothetical protein